MFWAIDPATGKRIQARYVRPALHAICPMCGSEVVAKTGNLTLWHWAHLSLRDCDGWSESEGEWHLGWKARIAEQFREVVLNREVETEHGIVPTTHRADVLNSRGTIIELQHSSISSEEIAARESFYENMIWIFDASDWTSRFEFRRQEDHHAFRWKRPHKALWSITKPLYFDLGRRTLFLVKRINPETPCHGYGHFIDQKTFVRMFFY